MRSSSLSVLGSTPLAAGSPQSSALILPTPPAIEVPGLYVHIPFCFHKCHYCDFYSITGQSTERMSRFVDLLLVEARKWTTPEYPHPRPRTVFFGGGTPSLLPLEDMRRLLVGLRELFDCSACDEWTIEANPATVTQEYCHMLKENGVTRMSFGAQSFDRSELKMLERHHNPDDVAESVAMARSAGINRLNVDLIYAICGQTEASWSHNLESALALGTEHLSCYGLTFEPNTALTQRLRQGQVQPVAEETELNMLAHTRATLSRAGLPPYEISNYSKPGAECRHNLLYWTGGDYLSIGPSAASHVQGWRWKNAPNLGTWETAIETNDSPAHDVEHLSPLRRAGELAMLTLRLSRGIHYDDYSHFNINARQAFADPVDRYTRMGFLTADDTGARLTEAGIKVADSLAGEFLLEEEIRHEGT
jgi:oxygen-independent coproporphyrinogen-3 oxidase